MSTPPRHADARVARIVQLFEGLTRADLVRLVRFYAPDATFKDPFNAVQGVEAVRRVFGHMFDTLDEPRFVVHDIVVQGDQCFLSWDFEFGLRRRAARRMRIHGASHLRLGADGRIACHRDYWDAAEELYEKLPLLGALMRWLRRRLQTPP